MFTKNRKTSPLAVQSIRLGERASRLNLFAPESQMPAPSRSGRQVGRSGKHRAHEMQKHKLHAFNLGISYFSSNIFWRTHRIGNDFGSHTFPHGFWRVSTLSQGVWKSELEEQRHCGEGEEDRFGWNALARNPVFLLPSICLPSSSSSSYSSMSSSSSKGEGRLM